MLFYNRSGSQLEVKTEMLRKRCNPDKLQLFNELTNKTILLRYHKIGIDAPKRWQKGKYVFRTISLIVSHDQTAGSPSNWLMVSKGFIYKTTPS